MNNRTFAASGIALLIALASTASGQIAPAYSLTDIGNLGATSGGPFFPRYISPTNQIVGVSPTGTPGQFSAYSSMNGGPMTNIGGLGGNSAAFAVNSSGHIVGQSENGGITTATQWIGGAPSAVPGLAGPNNAAGGINESGQIAGWMDAPGGAVAYRKTGGTVEDFGNLGGRVSDINGLNASGRFVGNSETAGGGFTSFRAFISSSVDNSLINLGLLDPGDTASLAFGINDSDTVIGTSNFFQASPFAFRASGFVWQAGVMTEIPRPAGYDILSPSGINNAGLIVGRITPNAFSTADEAWIYDGGSFQLLTGLLTTEFAGWRITSAWEINDGGFIAAQAVDPFGVARNVLLSPVPEPASLAMLALAVPWFMRRR